MVFGVITWGSGGEGKGKKEK